jgi:hypothetical protein
MPVDAGLQRLFISSSAGFTTVDSTPTYTPQEVVMARQLAIEEEAGTSTGWRHPHNGYYAGDFSTVAPVEPTRPRVSAETMTRRVLTAPVFEPNARCRRPR